MKVSAVPLRDLLLDTRDGDWGVETPDIDLVPYRVIRGTDFSQARYGDLSSVPLRYLTPESASRRTLRQGDILIETAGGSRERPTGRTLLVTDRLLRWSEIPLTCASFCRFLRVNPALAEPDYVYWYLQYLYAVGAMWQHQVQHTGIARFQYTRFAAATEIPLPSRSEQHAIASILGSLDDKIELNRRMNETLEAMARALFKSWFVDFDPVRAKAEGQQPVGMGAETAALFPDGFEACAGREVPKGWFMASLRSLFPEDATCVLTGPFGSTLHASDYRESGTPLILVKHVNGGHILEDDIPLVGDHKLPELERYRLKVGDIVFTRVGAVGRSAYVFPRYTGWLISGQMLRVRVPETGQLSSRYLAQVYDLPSFIDMVEGYAVGSTRPSLNTSLLLDFNFLVPPESTQAKYAAWVAPLDARIQSNLAESRTLSATRDALLPKLLSGEIRVKEAEKVVEEVMA